MEKRKFTINYDKFDDNEEDKDKYTFIIPNSNIEDINISVKKKTDSKEKEMEDKN